MNRKSWIILLAAYAAGVLATFAQFAVPPVLPALRAQFGMSYTQAGMLMSLFAVATLVFAAPCGFVIQRWGVRRVGLLGFLLLAAGAGLLPGGPELRGVPGRPRRPGHRLRPGWRSRPPPPSASSCPGR